jgi:DNA-binding NarL/FixJ family response regulator
MTNRLIRVAIIEDDPKIRQLSQIIIDGSPGFYCQQAFEDCESALPALRQHPPDILLLDIDLPGISGIEGLKLIKASLPQLAVVMLTVHEEDDVIFDSLCAGAVGYLVKGVPPHKLIRSIEEAYEGGAPMSGRIARKVVQFFHQKTKTNLTQREEEVLKLLCKGGNYRTIAEALFISTNTVKAHIKKIYEKLHVHNRAEAVAKAIKDRLV